MLPRLNQSESGVLYRINLNQIDLYQIDRYQIKKPTILAMFRMSVAVQPVLKMATIPMSAPVEAKRFAFGDILNFGDVVVADI